MARRITIRALGGTSDAARAVVERPSIAFPGNCQGPHVPRKGLFPGHGSVTAR